MHILPWSFLFLMAFSKGSVIVPAFDVLVESDAESATTSLGTSWDGTEFTTWNWTTYRWNVSSVSPWVSPFVGNETNPHVTLNPPQTMTGADCNRTCMNGGRLSLPACRCMCSMAFYGDRCQHTFVDADCNRTCMNGGRLTLPVCMCSCSRAFYGDRCQHRFLGRHCNRTCMNGGSLLSHSCECMCPRLTYGDRCQLKSEDRNDTTLVTGFPWNRYTMPVQGSNVNPGVNTSWVGTSPGFNYNDLLDGKQIRCKNDKDCALIKHLKCQRRFCRCTVGYRYIARPQGCKRVQGRVNMTKIPNDARDFGRPNRTSHNGEPAPQSTVSNHHVEWTATTLVSTDGTGAHQSVSTDESSVLSTVTKSDKDITMITTEDTEMTTDKSTESVTEKDTKAVTAGARKAVTAGDRKAVTAGDRKTVTAGDTKAVTAGDTKVVTEGDTKDVTEGDTMTVTTGDTKTFTAGGTKAVTAGDTKAVTEGNTMTLTAGDTKTVTEIFKEYTVMMSSRGEIEYMARMLVAFCFQMGLELVIAT